MPLWLHPELILTIRFLYYRTFITAEKGRGSSVHNHLSDAASFPQKWEICSLPGDETELLPHDTGKHSIPDCTEERQSLLSEANWRGTKIPSCFNFCITRSEVYHTEESRTAAGQHRGDRKDYRRSDEDRIKIKHWVMSVWAYRGYSGARYWNNNSSNNYNNNIGWRPALSYTYDC